MRQSLHLIDLTKWYVRLNRYVARSRSSISSLAILIIVQQEVDETPDYSDSDTNPNTTASSVAGDLPLDGRKKRAEANQLRRSIFGKKHDALGESKVCAED
jgi:hypothetical protein